MPKAYQHNASTLSSSTLPYLITAIVLAVSTFALLLFAVVKRKHNDPAHEDAQPIQTKPELYDFGILLASEKNNTNR